MKLKKAYIYILSFICMSVLFSACYFLSYQHALKNFNKRAIERNGDYASLKQAAQPSPMLSAQDDASVSAGTQPSDTILPSTKYILEIYNMKTNALETQTLNLPGYLVGLKKEDVEAYLTDYMKDLPLSEYNKGLISYELTSFSEQEIHLRKTYNEDVVPFRFYVVVKDGYVVVYNSDLKSVYSYTHIEAKNLPEEDRIALSMGIYVNNLDELYALLESYSS